MGLSYSSIRVPDILAPWSGTWYFYCCQFWRKGFNRRILQLRLLFAAPTDLWLRLVDRTSISAGDYLIVRSQQPTHADSGETIMV